MSVVVVLVLFRVVSVALLTFRVMSVVLLSIRDMSVVLLSSRVWVHPCIQQSYHTLVIPYTNTTTIPRIMEPKYQSCHCIALQCATRE